MADRDPGLIVADPSSYGVDVFAWTRAQATLLRDRRFGEIDLNNLIEEIESLGNEQIHSIESYMVVLVEHLTKLAVSQDQNPRRVWCNSVGHARGGIARRLKRAPSLRRQLPEIFVDAWSDARRDARGGLHESEEHLVPNTPPFTFEQALDPDFFPGD